MYNVSERKNAIYLLKTENLVVNNKENADSRYGWMRQNQLKKLLVISNWKPKWAISTSV
jgi:hypothetical protein